MNKIFSKMAVLSGLLISSTAFGAMEMQQWCEVQLSNAGYIIKDVQGNQISYEELFNHYVLSQRDLGNRQHAKEMLDVAIQNKGVTPEAFVRYWAQRCPDDFNRGSYTVRERQHYGY